MTVRQLGNEMDSAELIEWLAFERLEPFGSRIEDLRTAYGPSAIINNMRRMFGGKDADLIEMDQLIPWYEREPEKLLFDPAEPGYDAEAHAAALRSLLMAQATQPTVSA